MRYMWKHQNPTFLSCILEEADLRIDQQAKQSTSMANGRFRFRPWGNGHNAYETTEAHHAHGKPVVLDCPPVHNNGGNRIEEFISEGKRMSSAGNILQRLQARQNEHNNNHGGPEPLTEASSGPVLITEGGWERPSLAGWNLPANQPLTKETVPTLKDQSAYAKKTDYMNTTIDSREAAKKYGGKFI